MRLLHELYIHTYGAGRLSQDIKLPGPGISVSHKSYFACCEQVLARDKLRQNLYLIINVPSVNLV